jgi:hypothetical protein
MAANVAQLGSTSRETVSISITVPPRIQVGIFQGESWGSHGVCQATGLATNYRVAFSADDSESQIGAKAPVSDTLSCEPGSNSVSPTPASPSAISQSTRSNSSRPKVLLIIPE